MITFPSNPTIGQLHEVGGRSFRFNGTGWVVAAIPGGVVTQTTGQSIADVMSQKAVTDEITGLGERIVDLENNPGTTNHQDMTIESRNATGAHPNLESALATEIQRSVSVDTSLQNQIFAMQENNPVAQTRYLTRDQIVLNAETLYQSKVEKDGNPTFEITANITATTAETANLVANWVGIALVNELELIEQVTQLFIKARKNATNRNVVMFARFFDRTSGGIKTLKGTSSHVILTETTTAYDLYFPIQTYIAAVGSRGQIDLLAFQTGSGLGAEITAVIEGDYYSRWSYIIPVGSLSLLDEKLISTQDLPSLNLLAGVTQKEVNAAQNNAIEALNGRVDDVEVRMEGLEQNSSAIIPYRKYFIDIINGDDSNDGLSSDTAFKSTAILNDLLPTIAVKSVEIVLIGPSGLSDFGRIEVKNPLCLNTLIVEGYRNYGDSDVSTIEVDIVALDEFWFSGVVTGKLERIGLIKNKAYWYATLKDITIWHSHNISLSYNFMTNVIFYYCSIYLKSIYSNLGARFQNCIIVGDINGLSPDSIENCLFKDAISVTQEDLYLLDSKITEAVNSIGTTIDDINGSINDINGSINDINSSINDINSSIGTTIDDINSSIDDINGSINDINSSIDAININNEEQDLLNANHEQRLDIAENQLTFAAIYGYYNFI